jgi:hypothetical protein
MFEISEVTLLDTAVGVESSAYLSLLSVISIITSEAEIPQWYSAGQQAG